MNRFIVTLALLVFLLAACAPASTATEAPAALPPVTVATEALVVTTEETSAAATEEAPVVTEAAIVVTPRGDALQATDPASVQLASGDVQLLEFFAFW